MRLFVFVTRKLKSWSWNTMPSSGLSIFKKEAFMRNVFGEQ